MITLQDLIDYFKSEFQSQFSYIAVSETVLENTINKVLSYKDTDDDNVVLDRVKDYILSQGLEEEVVL